MLFRAMGSRADLTGFQIPSVLKGRVGKFRGTYEYARLRLQWGG